MKKFENLGKKLSKKEQKNIKGGTEPISAYKCCWDAYPDNCSACVTGADPDSCVAGSSAKKC